MSFILDALRRSDQERQRERLPSVRTVHAQPPAAERTPWFYLAAAILVVGVAVAGALLWMQQQPASLHSSQAEGQTEVGSGRTATRPRMPQAATRSSSRRAAVLPVAPEPQITADRSDESSQHAAAEPVASVGHADARETETWMEISPQTTAASTEPLVEEASGEIPFANIHALPPSVQQQLPPISIAALIYDRDATARMAIINNRSVREGDALAAGLTLEAIDENGIVLDFQGRRFHMNVFQNWKGN